MQVREFVRFDCHVKVGWEDGDEQSDQAPPGRSTQWTKQQSEAAGDLRHAADRHKRMRRWEIGGNNSYIKPRTPEMVRAGANEENSGR